MYDVVISVSLSVPVIDCWKSLVRGGDGYQIRRDWPPRRSRSWLVWWLKLSSLSVREELDRPGFSVVSTFHDNKPMWKVTDLSFHHYENVWENSFLLGPDRVSKYVKQSSDVWPFFWKLFDILILIFTTRAPTRAFWGYGYRPSAK